ncbi:MAG: response regulator [Pyrinomonadaceae bacterium]
MPPKRILCVDDNEDTCDLLKTMLGMAGFDIISVPDAAEALRLIESERFDLYVLDSEMPGFSGLTLCNKIRAVDTHTPIVIFSGHGFESHREAGMLAGANAYLVKPDVSELIPTVKRLLEGPRAADL